MYTSSLLCLTVMVSSGSSSLAFSPTLATIRSLTRSSPSYFSSSSSYLSTTALSDAFQEPFSDLEEARANLERWASNQTTTLTTTIVDVQVEDTTSVTGSSTAAATVTLAPLTANVEKMKETECRLLRTLQDSNHAIEPLVDLWVKDRHSQELHKVLSQSCNDMDAEEEMLRQLSMEHGIDDGWVEPHSRLAVLCFHKGYYLEVLDLCELVLYVKPWHFEMAMLLRTTLLLMGDFVRAVRVTRDLVLPPLWQPKRRTKWVQKMSTMAKDRLQTAQALAIKVDTSMDECDIDDPASNCWQ